MSGRRRDWRPGRPVDLAATLGPFQRGYGDPTMRWDSAAVWRASLTPDGAATLRLAVEGGPDADEPVVRAEAWGPGAAWALESVPELLGVRDEVAGFAGFGHRHPLLQHVAARHRGLRVPRCGRVLEVLVPAVLEQKVTGAEAHRSWREVVRRFGEPAPGPVPPGLTVPPGEPVWAGLTSWQWHLAGVDEKRWRTIRAAAQAASRLEETLGFGPAEADRRLQAVPGVGPWTSAEVRQRAHGDADAVSVGDYNLPALVGLALAGAPADDAGMLALLEAWPGHRHRVTRLVELAPVRVPRRAPRLAPRDYRAI